MLLYLLLCVLIIVSTILFVTQFLLPTAQGKKTFPLFRSASVLEQAAENTKEEANALTILNKDLEALNEALEDLQTQHAINAKLVNEKFQPKE